MSKPKVLVERNFIDLTWGKRNLANNEYTSVYENRFLNVLQQQQRYFTGTT